MCSFTTKYAPYYIRYAEKIQTYYPHIITACGGAHPSARPHTVSGCFNTVCVGEGEITLKDIIDNFDARGNGLGIVQGQVVKDLDAFPAFPRLHTRLGPVEIMRGCPGRCRYCQTPRLFPGKIRYRSPEMVEEEIRYAAARKSQKGLLADARFIAPDAGSYRNAEILLQKTRQAVNGGKVFFGTFPSEIDPLRVTPHLVNLMQRYCDNKNVVIGLQSGSERMLKHMGRKATPDDASRAIELLLKSGFEVIVDFIFGLPFEDDISVEDNIRWLNRWKDQVIIHSHPYMPLPGSEWENLAPAPVPEKLLAFLKSLEGKKGIFGGYELR